MREKPIKLCQSVERFSDALIKIFAESLMSLSAAGCAPLTNFSALDFQEASDPVLLTRRLSSLEMGVSSEYSMKGADPILGFRSSAGKKTLWIWKELFEGEGSLQNNVTPKQFKFTTIALRCLDQVDRKHLHTFITF